MVQTLLPGGRCDGRLPAMKRLARALLAAGLIGGMGGCSGGDDEKNAALPVPELRCDTAIDRQETLDAFHAAWESRTTAETHEGKRAEIGFLGRLAAFVKQVRGTESYTDATRLWKKCVKEHTKRFP